jgi:hypothetical protein
VQKANIDVQKIIFTLIKKQAYMESIGMIYILKFVQILRLERIFSPLANWHLLKKILLLAPQEEINK